jgi:hypothetical protein
VADQIAAFQKQYQADSPLNLNAPNPNYIGSLLEEGLGFGLGATMYDPNFQTPRSVQMNIGMEREIRPGIIFSADFVRNVQTRYLLGVDENHTGDIRYFNKPAAQAAINATLAQCGVTSIQAGINSPCPSGNFVDVNQNPRPLLMPATALRPQPISTGPVASSSAIPAPSPASIPMPRRFPS